MSEDVPARYSVVTGYHHNPIFFHTWCDNTIKYAKAPHIFVIDVSQSYDDRRFLQSQSSLHHEITVLSPTHNFGYYLNMPEEQRLCGWSMGMLLGAFHCYHDHVDMIYKEGDCLAFGPWVERLYTELGDKKLIIGQKNSNNRAEGLTAQSIFLCKWEYLHTLIRAYLQLADAQSDRWQTNEAKFDVIETYGATTRTTMGVDRSRPIPYDAEAFYVQQVTDEEMGELRKRRLV